MSDQLEHHIEQSLRGTQEMRTRIATLEHQNGQLERANAILMSENEQLRTLQDQTQRERDWHMRFVVELKTQLNIGANVMLDILQKAEEGAYRSNAAVSAAQIADRQEKQLATDMPVPKFLTEKREGEQ